MVTMDLLAILLVIQTVSVAIKIVAYVFDVLMVTMETTAPVIAVIIV